MGLFTRASDLIKWENQIETSTKKEATPELLTKELEMQAGIYNGKVKSPQQIIDSDLTHGQKKGLLGELRTTQAEARREAREASRDAREAASQEKAIYKSPEYKAGYQWIERMLQPEPNAKFPFSGEGNTFQVQERAAAILEFTKRAATVSNPQELNQIQNEIADRYLKRRKAQEDKSSPFPALEGSVLRFNNPADVAKAARSGLLSYEEVAQHLAAYKAARSR